MYQIKLTSLAEGWKRTFSTRPLTKNVKKRNILVTCQTKQRQKHHNEQFGSILTCCAGSSQRAVDNPLTSSSGISHNFIWKVKTHLDITKENTHLNWTILGGQSGAFVRYSLNFKPFNSRIEQEALAMLVFSRLCHFCSSNSPLRLCCHFICPVSLF